MEQAFERNEILFFDLFKKPFVCVLMVRLKACALNFVSAESRCPVKTGNESPWCYAGRLRVMQPVESSDSLKGSHMKKTLIVAAVAASFATAANAQSSVTLYGLVDAGFSYVNNEAAPNTAKGSAAAFRLSRGNLNGRRWGLRGAEDLGGGMKAIFTLESGFSMGNGQALQGQNGGASGTEFGRQAFAGISTAQFGTVTLGRQYDSVVDYLAPMTATGSWGGTYFAHPFDNDNANNSFRVNNSVKYQSANYSGFTFGGLYGFSNQAGGFGNNRAYSAGAQYANGPFKIAAAYLQLQNPTTNAGGAVNDEAGAANTVSNLVQNPVQTQRTYGVGANYAIGPVTVGGAWTQSRFQFAVGDSTARFNNYEVNA